MPSPFHAASTLSSRWGRIRRARKARSFGRHPSIRGSRREAPFPGRWRMFAPSGASSASPWKFPEARAPNASAAAAPSSAPSAAERSARVQR